MKVILLESVAKVGRQYDIVDVAPGYARNFLMPRALAEAVTERSAGRIAEFRRKKEAREAKMKEAFVQVAKGAKSLVIPFSKKANEEGHLFAGIDRVAVAAEASRLLGVEVLPETVDLDRPIKEVGEKETSITAHGTTIPVLVKVSKED